jgi:chorismate dehydratase
LPNPSEKIRVCAVSYLNTTPLVWGMLYGDQRGRFDLTFRVPAECADLLAAGDADIGIVPSFELSRQELRVIPGVGIASRGPVRSILLVSKRPFSEIELLATDASSRTSAALCRVILSRQYGVTPETVSMPPDLDAMLDTADAALLIGDPALRVDPASLPFRVADLGREWTLMTGLPMVFAVWAGRPESVSEDIAQAFRESCRFGLEHVDDIVEIESVRRSFPPDLVRRYLSSHIVYELGPAEYEGLDLFLRTASEVPSVTGTGDSL